MEEKNRILIIGVDKEIHSSITEQFDTQNFECVPIVYGKRNYKLRIIEGKKY